MQTSERRTGALPTQTAEPDKRSLRMSIACTKIKNAMHVAQKLNLAVETRNSKLGFETSKSRETDDGWVSLILTRGRPGDFHLGKEGRKVGR